MPKWHTLSAGKGRSETASSTSPRHGVRSAQKRMRVGSTVVERGSKRSTDRVDPRTLEALVRYGMVKRDPDGVYRTTDTPLLMP